MRLSTARSLCSHLAALIAYGAMASGGDLGGAAAALFVIIGALSWLKGDRRLPDRLSVAFVAAVIGIALVLVFLVIRGALDGIIAIGAFCAVLTLNLLLARSGPADEPPVYLTAFFMLAVGAVLSGELTYGLCFVGFAVAVTIGLTLTELDRQAEAARVPAALRGSLLTPPLVQWLFALSGASLLMAGAFFVFFPRVNSRWAFAHHSGANPNPVIGFGAKVELGGEGTLRDDPRPVLRIQLPELTKENDQKGVAPPDRLDYLFRAQALDTFDGRSWSVAKQKSHVVPSGPPPHFDGLLAEIEVLPVADAALVFSPGRVAAASLFGIGAGPSVRLQAHEGGDVIITPKPAGRYQFRVWADREPASSALAHLGNAYPDDVRKRDLQLPERLDPRIPELARTWTRGLTDPSAQAAAIVRHLHEDYAYTLVLPGDVPDPLAHFLFERKAGHCEYFSTAMTILLRTLGVPAREVTGFAGAVLAPGSEYYVARAGDAHSWVEAYFPTVGFATFDPTPPSFHTYEASSIRTYLSAAIDVLEQRWQTSVVSYDLLAQVRGVRELAAAIKSVVERFEKPVDAGSSIPWRVLALVAFLGAIAFVGYRLLRRRRRSLGPTGTEAEQAYAAMLKRLQRAGIARRAGETPRELALRVESLNRREAAVVRELTRLHEEVRFANRPWTEADRRRTRELMRSLAGSGPAPSSPA